jgi:hypothetical protein
MSLEEFRAFVNNSGVEFDKLNNDDKIRYRVDFERSRQAVQPTGKCTFKQYLFIVNHIEYDKYTIINVSCHFSGDKITFEFHFK